MTRAGGEGEARRIDKCAETSALGLASPQPAAVVPALGTLVFKIRRVSYILKVPFQ